MAKSSQSQGIARDSEVVVWLIISHPLERGVGPWQILGQSLQAPLKRAIQYLREGGADENLATLAPLMSLGAVLYLWPVFYPMLVFATTVSLYYGEHDREPLLAALATTTAPDQAASAP